MEKTDQKPLQKEKRTRSAGRIAGMAAGIAVVTDYTMAQLGRACSIAVGTAAAAALEE